MQTFWPNPFWIFRFHNSIWKIRSPILTVFCHAEHEKEQPTIIRAAGNSERGAAFFLIKYKTEDKNIFVKNTRKDSS